MAEYIEREAATRNAFRYLLPNGEKSPKVVFADAIDKIPAADVEPVKRGKWVRGNWHIRCSECGEAYPFMTPNYCPNCGARMEGVE